MALISIIILVNIFNFENNLFGLFLLEKIITKNTILYKVLK